MIIDTVVQPILREELTPADGLPGDLLTDIQIRALPLYQQIIANTNTKHFTAVAKGYHWDVGGIKQKFEENVKNLERVVRVCMVWVWLRIRSRVLENEWRWIAEIYYFTTVRNIFASDLLPRFQPLRLRMRLPLSLLSSPLLLLRRLSRRLPS